MKHIVLRAQVRELYKRTFNHQQRSTDMGKKIEQAIEKAPPLNERPLREVLSAVNDAMNADMPKAPVIEENDHRKFGAALPEDLRTAPPNGRETYKSLTSYAETYAHYLEEVGKVALERAEVYKEERVRLATESGDDAIRSALEFKDECERRAGSIRREAELEARRAVSFTKRIDAMGKALGTSTEALGEDIVPEDVATTENLQHVVMGKVEDA